MGYRLLGQITFEYRGSPAARATGDFIGDSGVELIFGGGVHLDRWLDEPVPFKLLRISSNGELELVDHEIGSVVMAYEGFTADLNGDGRHDFFSVNTGWDAPPYPGEANTIILGGTLHFSPPSPRADFHHSGDVGDIDGDGDVDLLIGGLFEASATQTPPRYGAYVLINDGAGQFSPRDVGLYKMPTLLLSSALIDLNGDGKLDFVGGARAGAAAGWVYFQDGDKFVRGVDLPQGLYGADTNTFEIAALDYDGDGDLDLALGQGNSSYWGSAVQLLRNDGGTFKDVSSLLGHQETGLEGWISRLYVADLNSDGRLDIVTSRGKGGEFYLSVPDGTYLRSTAQELGLQGEKWLVADINQDGLPEIVTFSRDQTTSAPEPMTVRVFASVAAKLTGSSGGDTIQGTGLTDDLTGDEGHDLIYGFGASDVLRGGHGDDTLYGDVGDDLLWGDSGNDHLHGGAGTDYAVMSGSSSDYVRISLVDGLRLEGLSSGALEGTDDLYSIEVLKFTDQAIVVGSISAAQAVPIGVENVLRLSSGGAFEAALLTRADLTPDLLRTEILKEAAHTTSVATLAYQFFTGKVPTGEGLDYLVGPKGPNLNNLNSDYYQSFNIENRYINFSVNLGKHGEGSGAFAASYGGLSLFDATKKAYATIFGMTPSDARVHDLLDPVLTVDGQPMSRSGYFSVYGQDGPNGIGTKAAMVGWLLAEAVKADVGSYAKANSAYLIDLVDGADFLVDLVGVYGRPEYAYGG